MDLKKGKLDIGLFIPIIKVDAKYDLKGNILLLPLVGVGDARLYLSKLQKFCGEYSIAMNINFFVPIAENVTTNVQTRIHFPKVKDEVVMVASSMRVEFSLTTMKIYLSNLFNGNQVLGKSRMNLGKMIHRNMSFPIVCISGRTVNTFLNENAKEVVDELKENIGESLSGIFKKIMNDAFSHIPTRLWLLED